MEPYCGHMLKHESWFRKALTGPDQFVASVPLVIGGGVSSVSLRSAVARSRLSDLSGVPESLFGLE